MPNSPSHFSILLGQIAVVAGCQVSLDDLTGITLHHEALRIHPEHHWHQGDFCRFMKLRDANRRCSLNKRKSKVIALQRKEPFWGCCPFGVWDLAWPVLFQDQVVAVLYLGYFQGNEAFGRSDRGPFQGPAPEPMTSKIRKQLLGHARFLAEHICLVLEHDLHPSSPKKTGATRPDVAELARRFIAANFREPISLSDFSAHLRMHPNYVGSQIQATAGMTFRAILRDYRIQQAMLLLANPERQITEAAMECGFQDSNYFSSTFRAVTGMSPRAWRCQRQIA